MTVDKTWKEVAEELAEALRLTREYVGESRLPAVEGWAWFDATQMFRARLAMEVEPSFPSSANNNELVGCYDAYKWADHFIATVREYPRIVSDRDTMMGWFANCLMSGHDTGVARERSRDIRERISEIAYLAAGAGSGAVMQLPEGRDIVMPSEDIKERVELILREHGIAEEEEVPA